MENFETKAKWAADVIAELGLSEQYVQAFTSGNQQEISEFIEVAMEDIGRRIEKMQTQLLTNQNASEQFKSVVLGMVAA